MIFPLISTLARLVRGGDDLAVAGADGAAG
jgi:hypothetical protein